MSRGKVILAIMPQIPIVDRLFSEEATQPEGVARQLVPLQDFFNSSAIVVLGDPGAGKTTAFKQTSEIEPNSMYVTVRDFRSLGLERYRGKTLYLDALDEIRSRTLDGLSTMDVIRGRLDELGRPRFRLSCRAADWYESSDVTSLEAVSPDQKIIVLKLEPLSDSDIRCIISSQGFDPEDFIQKATQHGIYEILENPQTLLMVMDAVRGGAWPGTRFELFQKACEVLSQEHNEMHRRSSPQSLRMDELLRAAGQLCTVTLCSGADGIALEEGQGNADFVPLDTIRGEQELLAQAARRRLFRSEGAERVVPVHRTIAEYLAASYLCARVKEGLPLKRVLALITGHDGGTLSDLRGLFAWLACICRQHAETLIPIDPYGILLYGDASILSPSSKELIIKKLVDLAHENPWFRSESWVARPFGTLGVPEMEPVFQGILSDASQHPVALSCVLDVIHYGQPMPALRDLLIGIVRDNSRREFVREDALEAFINACPDRSGDLRELLNDVQTGNLQDANCQLRAIILKRLYPNVIGPAEIIDFIVDDPTNFVGNYVRWVSHELLNDTDPTDIPVLFDSISARSIPIDRRHRYSWCRFIGRLLQIGLNEYGETLSAEQIFGWLGVAIDQHGRSCLEEEDKKEIREWMEAHPDKTRELYQYWMSETAPDELRRRSYLFHRRLFEVNWPVGFAQWLLNLAVRQEDNRVSFFLFRESVSLCINSNRSDVLTIDDLYQFVEQNPRFRESLQSMLYCEIEEWKWEDMRHTAEHRQRQLAAYNERVRFLMQNLDQIRAGTHNGGLIWLAHAYFGHYRDVNRDLSPYERIRTFTNSECADIAFEGLVAALSGPDIPTAAAISEAHSTSQRYEFGFVILAGMDILTERSVEEMLELSENTLRAALAFNYAMGTGESRKWVHALIASRPGLVSEVLEAFWRIHLARDLEDVPGLYSLSYEDHMSEIARAVSIPLLREFPACRISHLEHLLHAGLEYGDREALLNLCRGILASPSVVREHRVLWYATAFTLNPEEFNNKMRRHIHAKPERAVSLLTFLFPSRLQELRSRGLDLPLSAIAMLISICGSVRYDRERRMSEDSSEIPVIDDYAHAIRHMIDKVAADASPEASDILRKLREQRNMAKWHDAIAHASALLARRRREAMFRFPTVDRVVATLSGGPPANPSDLQALIVDHLLTIRDDISHGSTDGYKAFWNINGRGEATSPKPEDYCRDRLLERIRERLALLGIDAEPEGHYAYDKRADIKVLYRGLLNIPVEIKRHYHRALWTALTQQLRDLYTRDPAAGGRGIYIVFWFGESRGRSLPKPPAEIQKPTGHEELEKALCMLLPEKDRTLIEVISIDCSVRSNKKKAQKRKTRIARGKKK
jgi:hypothetical protein